jgi:hypothetical protein
MNHIAVIEAISAEKISRTVGSASEVFSADGNALYIERPERVLSYGPPDFSNDARQADLLLEQGRTGVSGLGQMSYDLLSGNITCGPEFVCSLGNIEIEAETHIPYFSPHMAIADIYHNREIFSRMLKFCGRVVDVNGPNGRPMPTMIRRLRSPAAEIAEPVFSPFGLGSSNYFHFVMDVLPRLRALYLYPELRDVPILSPVIRPGSFGDQVLRRLGLQDRLREVRTGTVLCRTVYLPSMMSPGGISREQADCVRGLMFNAFSVRPNPVADSLLYISRRDSVRRRVLNEPELEEALSKLGFVTVVPGEMTAEEQVSAFSTARLVVGPIGSNNTNIVFAPDGTGVIELAPAEYCHPSIWMLAKQKGMSYGLVTTDRVDGNMNMVVNIDTVCDIAHRMQS